MTARPLDPESRRRPLCIAVTLVLVMAAVLLAAGCIGGQPISGNTTANVIVTVSPSALITQSVQTRCLSSGNVTPWIIINPIGNHVMGDVFEINGTTNLGIDEKIQIMIYGRPIPLLYPGVPVPSKGLSGLCKFQQGDCGINIWSYSANTSGFNTPDYFVRVGTENWTVENSTLFSVSMW